MDITDVYDVRRANLERLIRSRFEGNQAVFAARIERSPAQVSQWVKGRRNISDETRDMIETTCEARGWLDAGPQAASPPQQAAAPTLEQALEVLGIALAHDMPEDVREDLADALAKLARRHGQARDQQQVAQLLRPAASTGKRHAA